MKAITLWQPWASLVGRGKMIETRGYPTNVRGWVAIHASARKMPRLALDSPEETPFKTLAAAGITEPPYGAVVAVARLVRCHRIVTPDFYIRSGCAEGFMPPPVGQEYLFGNYEPGRYGWIFDDVRHLPAPIPAKGKQGWWNWEPPAGTEQPE